MCGRYTLSTRGEVLADRFGLDEVPSLAPRYNVAPTQEAAIVRLDRDARRRLDEVRWGLVPFWAEGPAAGRRAVNARSETAGSRPTFREPLRRRRCLVLADGFYEWRQEADGRVPHLIRMSDGEPFAMAGVWDRWRDRDGAGEVLETFTILTTRPNELVAAIHDRMPVILAAGEIGRWLRPREQSPEELAPLLVPYPAERMIAWAVTQRVNDPRRDDPRCIEPVPAHESEGM